MSLRKVLALTLVLCMVLSFFPVSAFAEDFVIEDQPEETEEYITTIEEQPEEPEQKEEVLVEETEQPEQEEELAEVLVDETEEPEEPAENTDEPQTPAAAPAAELQTPTLAAVNTPVLGLSLQAEEIPMLEATGTVQVNTQAGLNDAVAAAEAGTVVEINATGTYTLPNVPKNITIKGTVDGVAFNHTKAGNIASIPNGATFENVTFNFDNVDYHGFQHAGDITMKNCTLNGKLFSYGDMTFNGCKFIQENSDYHMWCYAGNITYENCTFTNNVTGKFLNVYNEDGSIPYTVTVENCKFINNASSSNKAALNVKETCGKKLLSYTVYIDNRSTTDGSFPGESTSDKLFVYSSLVQVDDRQSEEESKILVYVNNKQVYPAVPAVPAVPEAEVTVDEDGDVTATIPTGVFKSGESAQEVTIAPESGSDVSVTFDAAAAAKIAANADESKVTLKVEKTAEVTRESITTKTFKITMVDESDKPVFPESTSTAGTAKVTVPFNVPTGVYPHVYLVTGETRTSVPVFDYDDKTVTFVAEHFSDYEVTTTNWDADVITISTARELLAFANLVNGGNTFSGKTIKLDANINLNDVIDQTEYWTPIGDGYYKSSEKPEPQGHYFAGTFDGDGHTISNLRVGTTNNRHSAGLFGIVKGGTIMNLTVDNATVSNVDRFAGAIVGGALQNSMIDNCHVTGDVHIVGKHFVGGLAGLSYGTIQNCSVDANGSISAGDPTGADGDDVGGLVGYSSGTITNGNVSVPGTGASATLEISGIRQVGGLVGMLDKGSVDSASNVSGVRVKSVATSDTIFDGSKYVPTNTIGLTVGGSQNANSAATANNCTLYIATAGQLKAFRDAVNAGNDFAGQTVVLLNSIDLEDQAWEPIGKGYYHSSTYSTTGGYKPGSVPFAGTFYGGNNTISNLKVSTAEDTENGNGWAAGLFGMINGGTVKNLTINNATVSSATRFAGAVAGGVTAGTIDNCTVSGTVAISSRHFAGGVAGMSYGTIQNCQVTATGMISANDTRILDDESKRDGDDVGGLVGYINSKATVTSSTVNSSDLTVKGLRQVGKLVGMIDKGSVDTASTSNAKVVTPVASIEGATEKVFYFTLAEAFAAAQSGDTIKLLADVNLTATQEISKSMTIDLNDHNITANGARALWVKSGDVTITGSGIVSATGNVEASSSVIRVGDNAANTNTAKLTIGAGVTVSSDKCYGVTVFGLNDKDNDKTTSDIELVLNGKVNVTGTASAVSGNGTSTLSATTITINGEVTAANDYAIYHPGKGTLTVNGKVEGKGGIEAKGGSVTINTGAIVTATATAQDHSAYNNGASTSGYAIAAVSNPNYAGEPVVTITGGTITGKAIILADFNAPNNGTVTATSNEITIDDGYKWVEETAGTYKLVEATYVAQIGEAKYETLAEAFAKVKDGETITLLADVNLTDRLFVNAGASPAYAANNRYATTSDTRSITLDLDGHNITSSSNIALAGGSLNITGTGTISTTDSGFAPIEIRGTGDLASERTLTIGENVTLTGGEYGLNVFGSNNAQKNVITVNVNGTVNGTLFVLGNLSNTENNINITVNGTVVASNATGDEEVHTGIALNGNAKVIVNNGAIVKGDSGIEVRAGNLTVNGGTIEATAESFSYTANGSGTTTKGAAIAVAQHGTKLPTTATLNGGTLTGVEMIGVTDVNKDMSGVKVTATKSFTASSAIPEGYAWKETTSGDYTLVPAVTVTFNANGGNPVPAAQQIAVGGKVTEPTDPTKEGVNFGGWYKDAEFEEAWNFETDTVTSAITLYAKWTTGATAKYSATLTLNNNIDVNFYVYNLSDAAHPERYTVETTFNGETKTTSLAEAEKIVSQGTTLYHVIAASCRAEQMGDTVDIVVKYDDSQIFKYEGYSVEKYCENQIETSTDNTLLDLCKSTLEYGEYAQKHFSYKTDDLVTKKYSANKVVPGASPVPENYNIATATGDSGTFRNVSATLTLASELETNFYFQPVSGRNYTFTVTKGGKTIENPEILDYSGWIWVKVSNFGATELSDPVVVTGTDGTHTRTLTYSPMSYAYRMQTNAQAGNISQALYFYYTAAVAFFNAHQ